MKLDTSDWMTIGRSLNASYYLIEPRIIGVVPDDRMKDGAETAKRNIGVLTDFITEQGQPHGAIAFLPPIVSMDKHARNIYQVGMSDELFFGVALVGGTLLSRAIGAFFLGLSRPPCPITMVKSYEDALPWVRAHRERCAA